MRIAVRRNEKELTRDTEQIRLVAEEMAMMAERSGLHALPWHMDNCVDWRRGECQYLKNHLYEIDTKGDSGMMDAEEYRGV